MIHCIKTNLLFQSTPPSLAETLKEALRAGDGIISIHSAIASGDIWSRRVLVISPISIHSAIASGDKAQEPDLVAQIISIHSAIASGD